MITQCDWNVKVKHDKMLSKCFFSSGINATFGIMCPAVPPPVNTIVFIYVLYAIK